MRARGYSRYCRYLANPIPGRVMSTVCRNADSFRDSAHLARYPFFFPPITLLVTQPISV